MFGQMALVLPALFAVTTALSSATSASFTDDTLFSTQTVVAGAWIPTLTITVDGAREAALSYPAAPCIALETDLAETYMVYTLRDDVLPTNGTRYAGGCIEIPNTTGTVTLKAVAVHSANDTWASDEVSVSFIITAQDKTTVRSGKKDDDDEDENENEEKDWDTIVNEVTETFLPDADIPSVLPVTGEELSSAPEYPTIVSDPLFDVTNTVVVPTVLEEPSDAPNLDEIDEGGEETVYLTEVETQS